MFGFWLVQNMEIKRAKRNNPISVFIFFFFSQLITNRKDKKKQNPTTEKETQNNP
jgi:hypothetical protein